MAVEETTTTKIDDGNSGSDTVRKIVAAVVGLIVIILIVLAAKWLGDRVRERFFPSTPIVEIIPPEDTSISTPSGQLVYDPKTGTYSSIPATGPNDMAYAMIAFLAVSGISTLALAKKFTS